MKVYRKPTHMDQYLQFDSNHPLEHKLGVVRSLHHRANTIVTKEENREKEITYVNDTLKKCGYPKWAINRATNKSTQTGKNKNKKRHTSRSRKTTVIIPYIKGVSEALRRTYGQFGITTYFKPGNTIRQILGSVKDPTEKKDVCGPVYYIPCQGSDTQECSGVYIGETERKLKTRFMEHKRPSSTSSEVSQHLHKETRGHTVDLDEVKILTKESRYFERGVKESIYIRVNNPSMNKDKGRHFLPHLWDHLIFILLMYMQASW